MNDYYAFDTGAMTEVIAAGAKAAAKQLEALSRRYAKRKLRIHHRQIAGQPIAEILKQAATIKAAYIVLGSHGHGAVFDLLVGSTTHGVLRQTQCPVLVVPMNPN